MLLARRSSVIVTSLPGLPVYVIQTDPLGNITYSHTTQVEKMQNLGRAHETWRTLDSETNVSIFVFSVYSSF